MDCPEKIGTKEFWSGQFGDDYLKRNRVDWRARIPFWKDIMDITGARSVHEFGCSAGWNLSAIRRAFPDVRMTGHDVNHQALTQARKAGLDCNDFSMGGNELVFTSGVLIHIAPEDLKATMQSIVDASCDYVLAVEYAAEQEEEVMYRGHEGRLWKRPYGKLYQDMGLTLVQEFDAGEGFDRCAAWLLKK